MRANDQLTPLDASFLELEQADDGALMHIGGALLFEPLPGGGRPAIEKSPARSFRDGERR